VPVGSWVRIDFAPEVSVVNGSTYALVMTSSQSGNTLAGNTGVYLQGNASHGQSCGAPPLFCEDAVNDFAFRIYEPGPVFSILGNGQLLVNNAMTTSFSNATQFQPQYWVPVGTLQEPHMFQINNTGAKQLSISSIGFTGSRSSDWGLSSSNLVVPAHSWVALTIQFDPQSVPNVPFVSSVTGSHINIHVLACLFVHFWAVGLCSVLDDKR
jgi:hypothetical protein